MKSTPKDIDVLCVGLTAFDLIYIVDEHLTPDVKAVASDLFTCGGGPAANAAVAVSKLGLSSALIAYLGNDPFGNIHFDELKTNKVNTDFIVRGKYPTPISSVLVKPNGDRALVSYRAPDNFIKLDSINISNCVPKVILFDGHEPEISEFLINRAKENNIQTILDAGSLHSGSEYLMDKVDYLVCSEKFALQVTKKEDYYEMLSELSKINPKTVITIGNKGLLWNNNNTTGELPAFKINAVDTTGAGDAFHGAFAYCLANNFNWNDTLKFSSATAALCCTKVGARTGLPTLDEVNNFLTNNSIHL